MDSYHITLPTLEPHSKTMPLQLSPELKQLLRMKKNAFVDYMCANSTKKELSILYKLLHYRNIEIDDAEQLIVDTFTKEELAESIYRIIHRKTFWNVSTVINCVSLLINSNLWLNSFSRIRRAYKSGHPQKISLLEGAGFMMHSLIVVSDLNALYKQRQKTRRRKHANRVLLDLHLQKSLSEPTRKKRTTPVKSKRTNTRQSPPKKQRPTATVSKRH